MGDQTTGAWWKKKIFLIPLILVVLVFGIRLVLEPVILSFANSKAKTLNPEFKGHIRDLDLSVLKGVLQLKDVTASLKNNDREFLEVKDVVIDLAWKELFKGNALFAVAVSGLQLNFEKDIMRAIKELPEKPKEKKELPFTISDIRVSDSRIVLNDYPGLNQQKALTVNGVHGEVRNVSAKKDSPLGSYEFYAGLSKKDDVKVSGNFDISSVAPRWDMNAKVKGFDLGSGNKALSRLIPMNFKKGTLDLYSEAKSEEGKIYGYVKPFLNNVEFMGNKNEFKGAKHFFVEVAGAVTDFVFENSDRKSVATRVPFIYQDGAFSVEGGGALVDAVQHGLLESDTVPRGIEQKYRLNRPNPKEVQAQEDDLKEAKEKKKEDKKSE